MANAPQLEPRAPSPPRRSSPGTKLIRASSSPRSRAANANPNISTKSAIAPAARLRTASRSASSIFLPIRCHIDQRRDSAHAGCLHQQPCSRIAARHDAQSLFRGIELAPQRHTCRQQRGRYHRQGRMTFDKLANAKLELRCSHLAYLEPENCAERRAGSSRSREASSAPACAMSEWHASPAPPSTCNARDGTSPAASTPRCLDDAWSRQPLTPLFRHHQLEGRLSKPTRITYRARPLPHLGAGPGLGIL